MGDSFRMSITCHAINQKVDLPNKKWKIVKGHEMHTGSDPHTYTYARTHIYSALDTIYD